VYGTPILGQHCICCEAILKRYVFLQFINSIPFLRVELQATSKTAAGCQAGVCNDVGAVLVWCVSASCDDVSCFVCAMLVQPPVLEAHPQDPRLVMSVGYDGLTILWDVQQGVLLRRYVCCACNTNHEPH
jgi:hypothetical protein